MSRGHLPEALARRVAGLSARDRRALLIGAALLVPVLGWAGVVRPYLAALHGLEDRLASERALLEREKAVLLEAAGLPARIDAGASALGEWEARLVRASNLALAEAEVTASLEEVGRENRVLLQEVRALPVPPGTPAPDGLQPIRLSVRGETDFEGVLGFLHGIERHPLLFRVVGLSVERPSVTAAGGGGDGRSPPVQPGAMAFLVIVEAFTPAGGDASGA